MLSPLTKEQRIKVEENMGLVGKVIQDSVHTLGAGSMFGYDTCSKSGAWGCARRPKQISRGTRWPFPHTPTV